ncbi:MAG: hypothetical protein JEZ06_09750 [Anaerolineaceae bacterium]|nr:hypothetical protein [Anaerolineaceae bacterium]
MIEFLLDPNLAYVLLVSGFILAILALFSPGTGILEVGALFALFLAGYSIFNLPINNWALILLLLGVFPFLLALRKSRHWAFLLLSILALIIGTVFLFKTEDGSTAIHPVLATVVSLISIVLVWFIISKIMEAVQLVQAHDLSQLINDIGEARSDIHTEGTIYVNGEEWTARSNHLIQSGSQVRILSREGLVLKVEEVIESEIQ